MAPEPRAGLDARKARPPHPASPEAVGDREHRPYFLCSAALPVAKRHDLQAAIKNDFDVYADITDGHGLAAHLAQPDLLWIAVEYLSIRAALGPTRVTDSASAPGWYQADLEKWRKRWRIRPTVFDVLDVRDGLRHATFNPDATRTRDQTYHSSLA